MDVPGATFLMNDVILTDGVVFAFSAFFRSSASVFFQIWRPVKKSNDNAIVTSTTHKLQLVYQLKTIPSVMYRREDVSLLTWDQYPAPLVIRVVLEIRVVWNTISRTKHAIQ